MPENNTKKEVVRSRVSLFKLESTSSPDSIEIVALDKAFWGELLECRKDVSDPRSKELDSLFVNTQLDECEVRQHFIDTNTVSKGMSRRISTAYIPMRPTDQLIYMIN